MKQTEFKVCTKEKKRLNEVVFCSFGVLCPLNHYNLKDSRLSRKERRQWCIMSSILSDENLHLLTIHIPFEWSNFPWLCLESLIVRSLSLKLTSLILQRRSHFNHGFHTIGVKRGSKEYASTLLYICSRGLPRIPHPC